MSTLESGKTYLISSKEALDRLKTLVNSEHQSASGATFVLTRNIDLENSSPSIGESGANFKGSFDGNNYCIYNLSGPLFSFATDVTVKKLRVKGDFPASQSSGTIVSYVYGTVNIENCISDISFADGSNKILGGIIATVGATATPANVTIKNCINNGNISTSRDSDNVYISGFVGYLEENSTLFITNCVNNGSISCSTTSNYLAGFSNSKSGGTSNIQYCVNNGIIKSSGSQIGAFTGDSNSTISSSRYYKPSESNITAKNSTADDASFNLTDVSAFDSSSAKSIAEIMNSYIKSNSDYVNWITNSSGFPNLNLQIEDVSN